MKEHFIDKDFGEPALKMIGIINTILEDYADQGYDLSLRQLYYQLVSRNIVENTERSYKNVGNLVSDARLAGMVDWGMIKDRGREMIQNPHWGTPEEFMKSVAPQYRFNLWDDQPSYIEVMVEKQALEGVLQPVCQSLDVPFTANKGYSSSSAMYEASKRYIKRATEGKHLYVVYLGDHDPSGIDMSRDVTDRLNQFIYTTLTQGRVDLGVLEDLPDDEMPKIQVVRIALNMDQVDELRPPENPAKITDSRAASYIQRFGHSSWELDAIEPRQLAGLVRDSIMRRMDRALFAKNQKRQEQGRKDLLKFAKTYLKS